MSNGPPPLPLIEPPDWLQDRSEPGPTAGTPPPSPDAWLEDIKRIMSHPEDKAFLDDLMARGVTITAFDRIYFEDPYYDGTQWTTKHFEAGGTTGGTSINMIRSASAAENAATIYHEGIHTGQPSALPWREKEYDAYVKEDRWRIAHGLPPHDPSFRTTGADGTPQTNQAAIRAMVDREYPGVSSTSASGAIEQVIGRTASGDTVVQRDDGSSYTRAPQAGDSFPGPEVTVPPGGVPVDLSKLK